MTDTRQKNARWAIHPLDDGTWKHGAVQVAVLMDIRDELQALNRIMSCHNTLDIPRLLRAIEKNTKKVRRKKK